MEYFQARITFTVDIAIADFSSDGSSRTRRVVTSRQHFQAASPPPLSSHMYDFFLSLSPTDISISRVEFSSDAKSRTRRVVTTRQHFQATSALTVFSNMQVSHQLAFPIIRVDFSSDGSSRTRRVVTTRQHFQAVAPPRRRTASTIFKYARFFLSLSPTDNSISRVDFPSDGSSRTRLVVTTRQHFQVSSLPPLCLESNFLLPYFHKNHDPTSA